MYSSGGGKHDNLGWAGMSRRISEFLSSVPFEFCKLNPPLYSVFLYLGWTRSLSKINYRIGACEYLAVGLASFLLLCATSVAMCIEKNAAKNAYDLTPITQHDAKMDPWCTQMGKRVGHPLCPLWKRSTIYLPSRERGRLHLPTRLLLKCRSPPTKGRSWLPKLAFNRSF